MRGENNPSWNGGNIVKVCEQCGGEFEVQPSRKDRSRFCSRECHGKWKSDNQNGENSARWNGGTIKKICEQCGEEFEVYPSRKDARLCSHECHIKWMSESQTGENNPSWNGGNIVKVCEQCGKEFEVKPSLKDKKRFCSRECTGKWQSENRCGENSPAWRGGISFEPYCHEFNEAFKESIREKFGRVCFLCPTTEEGNDRKLSIHHVSYNKDCLCDDSDCEFVPLCASCHSKTNFNREYWEQMIMNKLDAIPWK